MLLSLLPNATATVGWGIPPSRLRRVTFRRGCVCRRSLGGGPRAGSPVTPCSAARPSLATCVGPYIPSPSSSAALSRTSSMLRSPHHHSHGATRSRRLTPPHCGRSLMLLHWLLGWWGRRDGWRVSILRGGPHQPVLPGLAHPTSATPPPTAPSSVEPSAAALVQMAGRKNSDKEKGKKTKWIKPQSSRRRLRPSRETDETIQQDQ